MLATGPRSTYQLPPTPQANARQLAAQILASIRAENAAANEVRPGTITTACDGLPLINPLNGTNCNGNGGPLVLYNPQTRTVMTSGIGRAFTGVGGTPGIFSQTVHPFCDVLLSNLKAKRRFIDDVGNIYGPDGTWLSPLGTHATLETEYIHRCEIGQRLRLGDPSSWNDCFDVSLRKTTATPASLSFSPIVDIPGYYGTDWFVGWAQGMFWPSTNDAVSEGIVTTYGGEYSWASPHYRFVGLNDAVFLGSYTAPDKLFTVAIDGLGSPDTFSWNCDVGGSGSHVAITADPLSPQSLAYGVSVLFGNLTGHTLGDTWYGSSATNRILTRPGVACRGTITETSPCIATNSTFMLTLEMRADYLVLAPEIASMGSHALVVRDADTLALKYRKPLTNDSLIGDVSIHWTAPELFSISTNAEGLFFVHCYTTPTLLAGYELTPFPGSEFGAPNPRKIAVVSVNPATFEPTIQELITLQDNGYTAASTFAVAITQS